MSPKAWVRAHLWATWIWTALAVPTVLWWHSSILWVALLSVYANIASHFSAYQAARAELMSQGHTIGDFSG